MTSHPPQMTVKLVETNPQGTVAIHNVDFLMDQLIDAGILDGVGTFTDNTPLSLGTGLDSTILYDGSDTYWDLQAVGTGGLTVALGDTAPAPDNDTVHIWQATAGVVTSLAGTVLTLENSAVNYLSFLTPNTVAPGIIFGDPEDNDNGRILYNHVTPAFNFVIDGTSRLLYSAAVFEFQEATTISTTAGDLAFAPTGTNVSMGNKNVRNVTSVIGGEGTDLLIDANNSPTSALARRVGIRTLDTVSDARILVAYAVPTATEATPFWAQRADVTIPVTTTLDANFLTFRWDPADDVVRVYVNDGGVIRSVAIGTVI